jgi:hypothetical protein
VPKLTDSLTSKLQERVVPTLSKVRKVNPAVAKDSATRGAAGAKDVVKLSIDYLKQETKGPLAGVGRLVGAGLAAAVCFGTGLILLGLTILRGIQSALAYQRPKASVAVASDRGPMSGNWNWAPYFLGGVGCIILIAIAVVLMTRSLRSTGSGTK